MEIYEEMGYPVTKINTGLPSPFLMYNNGCVTQQSLIKTFFPGKNRHEYGKVFNISHLKAK